MNATMFFTALISILSLTFALYVPSLVNSRRHHLIHEQTRTRISLQGDSNGNTNGNNDQVLLDGRQSRVHQSLFGHTKKLLRQTASRFISSLSSAIHKQHTEPGRLILVRHGESEMNSNGSFTGWTDPDLTETGRRDMEYAARLMIERGYTDVDMVFSSLLKRSIRSTWVLLKELNQVFRPVIKSWRLNQRMYGALEGMTFDELAQQVGLEKAKEYQSSLYLRPPQRFSHSNERRYNNLPTEEIPVSESISDCFARTAPLLQQNIFPELRKGRTVVIVGHANSLKGIVRIIEGYTEEEAAQLNLPSAIPFVYKFDSQMKAVKQESSYGNTSFVFLENPKLLKVMLMKEKKWGTAAAANYKGLYSLVDYDNSSLMFNPVMQGLSKLQEERKFKESKVNEYEYDFDGDFVLSDFDYTDLDENGEIIIDNGSNFDAGDGLAGAASTVSTESAEVTVSPISMISQSSLASGSSAVATVKPLKKVNDTDEQYIVLIRHGRTEYNKLGVFTGWEDAPLAEEGRTEARKAGRLLKKHNFEFDIVYTSWLSRAIETAWLTLDELDALWLPMIKSWRLNERMYGSLTGMSKRGIAERFGDNQMIAWRRGYSIKPPPVDSFSLHYPGNDDRYVKYVKDLPISASETIMRSIARGKFQIHRKFPKSESLKDCMQRTIPYFTNTILPKSVEKSQRVLVASSENAIRGLLMHLCGIPESRIHEIDIPNGLPLIFSVKKKCIQILDEDFNDSIDTLQRYSFGKSPELLFKPCDYDNNKSTSSDGTSEQPFECFLGENGKSYKFDPIIRLKK